MVKYKIPREFNRVYLASWRGRKHPVFPNLNITALARATGLRADVLGRILKGEIMPRLDVAIRLSCHMQVKPETLLAMVHKARRQVKTRKG